MNNEIGCDPSGIILIEGYTESEFLEIQNLKEAMFTDQTSKTERKWFLCQNDRLIDVAFFCEFHFETRPDNIIVYGQFTNGNSEPIGYFKTKEEAKDYIKTIYEFIIGMT